MTENLLNLKVHKLSNETYEKLEEKDSTAIYLTPDDSADTFYVTAGRKTGSTLGERATAEGYGNTASGGYSHAEGFDTFATEIGSHAEGYHTTASGEYSHAEGYMTVASNSYTHAEGYDSQATGSYSHAEGEDTRAVGTGTHSEGTLTRAEGDYSHSEGYMSKATGIGAHAEGGKIGVEELDQDDESGAGSPTVEIHGGIALGDASHAEGGQTYAVGRYSHAEGLSTCPHETFDHLEIPSYDDLYKQESASIVAKYDSNRFALAYGKGSHVEGHNCLAYGDFAHAEGTTVYAIGDASHAEGRATEALHTASHAGGIGTKTSRNYQTAIGMFNADSEDALFIIGNGSATDKRKNAFEVKQDGTAYTAAGELENKGKLTIDGQDYELQVASDSSTASASKITFII